MTSELRVTTLSNATGDGPAALSQQSAAKAMAQYLGQTNVLQSGSINHSSITDNGTGVFSHNFSNNFANTAYLVIGSNQVLAFTTTIHNYGLHDDAAERTTSVSQMEAHYVNATANRTLYDFHVNDFTAFGDLA
jgi:hypothetical protein